MCELRVMHNVSNELLLEVLMQKGTNSQKTTMGEKCLTQKSTLKGWMETL